MGWWVVSIIAYSHIPTEPIDDFILVSIYQFIDLAGRLKMVYVKTSRYNRALSLYVGVFVLLIVQFIHQTPIAICITTTYMSESQAFSSVHQSPNINMSTHFFSSFFFGYMKMKCNENRLAFLFTFFRQHLIDAKSLSIFKCDSCVIRLLYSIYVHRHI